MLVGWIGRLDHQKGPDVVLDAVPGLMQRGCQVQTLFKLPQMPEDLQAMLVGRTERLNHQKGRARPLAVWLPGVQLC